MNLRGLNVVVFPHFCIKLATKTGKNQPENEGGALPAASTALAPENSV
jgi:hypothetical protein